MKKLILKINRSSLERNVIPKDGIDLYFNTDLLLSRSEISFLVASMYCEVARLLFCSLLIDSLINSPLPCPARVEACGELMSGMIIHRHDMSSLFYFFNSNNQSTRQSK